MITLSYKRFGNGIYISHTDVLRNLNRTLRRAKIDVNYSKGFNRHMSMKLTQPLPLGIASDDEWMTADISFDIDKAEFLKKFNENCPPYLIGKEAFITDKNPGLASKIIASDYEFCCPNAEKFKNEIEDLKNGFSLQIEKNGETLEKEFSSSYIYSIKVVRDKIYTRFCFGNKNLRADMFIQKIKETTGLFIPLTQVTRTKQLVEQNGKLIFAEEYMRNLGK